MTKRQFLLLLIICASTLACKTNGTVSHKKRKTKSKSKKKCDCPTFGQLQQILPTNISEKHYFFS